jgi:hypothetical protein
MEALSQSDPSTSKRPSAKPLPSLLDSIHRHPSNQSFFLKDIMLNGLIFPPVAVELI